MSPVVKSGHRFNITDTCPPSAQQDGEFPYYPGDFITGNNREVNSNLLKILEKEYASDAESSSSLPQPNLLFKNNSDQLKFHKQQSVLASVNDFSLPRGRARAPSEAIESGGSALLIERVNNPSKPE